MKEVRRSVFQKIPDKSLLSEKRYNNLHMNKGTLVKIHFDELNSIIMNLKIVYI